jgi:hypothetical protein
MKLLSIFGICCAIAVVTISVMVILQSPTRTPLRDDEGTLSINDHTPGDTSTHVNRGDFEYETAGSYDDQTPWYSTRHITSGQGTFRPSTTSSNESQPADDTQRVEDALNGNYTSSTEVSPQGIIADFVNNFWSTDTKNTLRIGAERTKTDPIKTRLHAYGNEVGSEIKHFVEGVGRDQNDILISFTANPNNNEGVLDVQGGYSALADAIDTIEAPDTFKNLQNKLANGYRSVADGLGVLSEASTNDMYDKMLTYNSHVEEFGSAFIQFALQFQALGITFSPDEPGGIFTPPVSAL